MAVDLIDWVEKQNLKNCLNKVAFSESELAVAESRDIEVGKPLTEVVSRMYLNILEQTPD